MAIKNLIDKFSIDDVFLEDNINKIRNEEFSKSDVKWLSKKISKYKNSFPNEILKYIFVYALKEPDNAIEIARKKGVFRYNAWGLDKNNALYILNQLKNKRELLNFSSDTLEYIINKIELSWLFDFYKETENKIVKTIMQHYKDRYKTKDGFISIEEMLYKELLLYADVLFLNTYRQNYSENLDKLSSYSIEQITDGISYLIFLCEKHIKYKPYTVAIVDPNYIKSKSIEDLILLGCKVCEVQEWELYVDYFSYKISKSDRVFTIKPCNELFEKSIRLGFVNSMLQTQLSFSKAKTNYKNVASLYEMFEKYLGSNRLNFVEYLKYSKIPRYTIKVPEILFDFLYKNKDEFFKEEILEINHCAKEFNMLGDELLNKKITVNCTLKDVIIFKRFFVLMDYIVEHQLLTQKNEKKIISSLLPVFNEKEIVDIFSRLYNNKNKATEIINLFTYDGKSKLDLQYTPFIRRGNSICVPLFLTIKSNLIRNCIANSYAINNQIVNQDDKETLVKISKEIFEKKDSVFQTFINQSYSYKGKKGELDLMLVTDNTLYLIECKSPLHPTSNFELRATNDHIVKAAQQLSNSRCAFEDAEYRVKYLKSLGVNKKPSEVKTCILMGNRLFNGFAILSHPIRCVFDINMVIGDGIIDSNIGKWRIWNQEQFTEKDFLDFLSPNYKIYTSIFDAMLPFTEHIHIKGRRLELSTYVLDTYQEVKNIDKCVEIIERDEKKFQKIANLIQRQA